MFMCCLSKALPHVLSGGFTPSMECTVENSSRTLCSNTRATDEVVRYQRERHCPHFWPGVGHRQNKSFIRPNRGKLQLCNTFSKNLGVRFFCMGESTVTNATTQGGHRDMLEFSTEFYFSRPLHLAACTSLFRFIVYTS